MTYVERGALWCLALALFLLINPVIGTHDVRAWQEMILVYGGISAAVVTMAGALPLSAAGLWIVYSAAAHKLPGALTSVMLLLCLLAVYALARRHGARWILAAIVAVNVAAVALQLSGAWVPLLQLFAPEASAPVYNLLHPAPGLTGSTGDLACVLAMALPTLIIARLWPLVTLAVVALLTTDALSGIAAGVVGALVALWPAIRARWNRDWTIGFGAVGLFGVGVALEIPEIRAALRDERWTVWAAAGKRWLTTHPIDGFGLGAWASGNMTMFDGATKQARVWTDMHFDLLQAGYDLGLIGVGLIVWAWGWLALRSWRAGNFGALGGMVALAVCQFGHFPMRLAACALVAALVAGEAARDHRGGTA